MSYDVKLKNFFETKETTEKEIKILKDVIRVAKENNTSKNFINQIQEILDERNSLLEKIQNAIATGMIKVDDHDILRATSK